jgi:diguanylate cyclase (GGDEF)-like protein
MDNNDRELEALRLRLAVEHAMLEMAADSANVGLWEYYPDKKLLSQSKKLDGKWSDMNLDIADYRDTVKGWGLIYPEDMTVFDRYCDSLDNGDPSFTYDLRAITDDYTFSWLRYVGKTIFNEDGTPAVVVGKTLDVTEEKKTIESVIRHTKEDTLTHVFSKDYIKHYINETIKAGNNGSYHIMMIVDVDDFKLVNEKFGRLYGDTVLEAVAAGIVSCITPEDAVGRIGNDEFAVFCPHIRDVEDVAPKLAEKIVDHIGELHFKDSTFITASVGVCVFPNHGDDFDALYKSADIALYQAKALGKNCYSIYSRQNRFSGSLGETERKALETASFSGEQKKTKIIRRADSSAISSSTIIETTVNSNYEYLGMNDIVKPLFDYCFDIVTRVEDFDTALNEIFGETGKYLDLDKFSRTEKNSVGEFTIYHSWRHGAIKDGESYTDILTCHMVHFSTLLKRFADKPYFIYNEGDERDDITNDPLFLHRNTKTMLQFPIFEDEELIGTVTFEDCKSDPIRVWTDGIIATLASITKMIASFAVRYRNKIRVENETLYTGRALENERLTYYVVDPVSFDIKYISAYANEIFPKLKLGEKCYAAALGFSAPCDFCPLKNINEYTKEYSLERYNKATDTWYSISASEIITADNEAQGIVCWTDVTAFLERVNSVDHLTGVNSYEKFRTEATAMLHDKQHDYAMVFAGIKHFNYINDQLGYAVGDEVLKLFAQIFSQILYGDEIMCRIKGDDFLLMLRNDMVVFIIDRIKSTLKSLEVIIRNKYPQINLICEFGTYRIKASDFSVSRCIDRANRAKKATANVAVIDNCIIYDYDDNIGWEENEIARLESMMYDAINTGQFHVYVQPKVDITNDRIGGAEALVRWIMPDGSFVPTFKFVTLFERNGFIVEVDKFVYNTLFRYIRKWLDADKIPPMISVNVSRLHLFDDSFPDYLNRLADRYNVPRKYIEVEITESVFFDNTEKLINSITELRNRGFVISMDDFGTGYSTLNLMKSLPIDIVKIDSGFFLNNSMDRKSRAVISSFIHLCKNLDLKIVCEGVETLEQVEYIKSEYCDYAQGFFYYRPMPIEEFEKLV